MLRRDYQNETVGILICGTKNDRSVRYEVVLWGYPNVEHDRP